MFAAALFASPLPAVTVVLGLFAIPWLIRLPALALLFLVVSLIFGQTIRLPLPGQGGGILLSDAAVVIVLLAALLQALHRRPNHESRITNHIPSTPRILWLVVPFIIWSAFSLALNASLLNPTDILIASAYWLRLSSLLLLLPALLVLFQDTALHTFARHGLLLTAAALLAAGAGQLWFMPDLAAISSRGWDPHQERLVSTWLDPNFFGAFIALTLPFMFFYRQPRVARWEGTRAERNSERLSPLGLRKRNWSEDGEGPSVTGPAGIILAAISFAALVLTQSRSALVALVGALALLSPMLLSGGLRHPSRARVVMSISFLTLFLIAGAVSALLLSDRLAGLLIPDATVKLRISSLQAAWGLAEAHPWIGVGAGAYQFAAREAGLTSDFTIHSRAGADNSFLTLWVTCGLIGLMLFLLPWMYMGHRLMESWLAGRNPTALAALAGIMTLVIHSQFVNSLLYAHLLITLTILTALALREAAET